MTMLKGKNVPVSKAKQRANNKYSKKAYDRIEMQVHKGEKEKIKAHAQKQGESVNGFINRSMKNQMESDNNENN